MALLVAESGRVFCSGSALVEVARGEQLGRFLHRRSDFAVKRRTWHHLVRITLVAAFAPLWRKVEAILPLVQPDF